MDYSEEKKLLAELKDLARAIHKGRYWPLKAGVISYPSLHPVPVLITADERSGDYVYIQIEASEIDGEKLSSQLGLGVRNDASQVAYRINASELRDKMRAYLGAKEKQPKI